MPNPTPQAAAYTRDQEAAAFQDLKRIVRDFGLTNALTMLADVTTEASLIEDDDWWQAAWLISECADACDLKYADNDEGTDRNEDAETVRLDNRMRLPDFEG